MTSALQSLVEQLEQDHSLDEPSRLRLRIEALDRLESHLMHRADAAEAASVGDRVAAIQARFEALNAQQYAAIRREIQCGTGAAALLELVAGFGRDAHDASSVDGEGYDYLDALIAGVLQFDEPGASIAALPSDMVFYQPTPARHIFDFLGRVALAERDVMIDLGAGLGHVPLLAAVCTRARCIGIELEPAYVDCARRSALALNLDNATFIEQDARQADLGKGTVFYLYTPFTGAILRSVLDSLRHEATQRSIRVCTLGPCTAVVAQEPWLEAVGTPQRDRIVVFRSVTSPVE